MAETSDGALQPLSPADFQLPADLLAPRLLGVIMCRCVAGKPRRARIIETEAYLGPRDLASHSSRGRTRRTEVMFGPAGRAYVYFVYGMHDMFNIVCGTEGQAHAVLIRGAEPLDGWTADLSGPGKLARSFSITRADNGMDLTSGDIGFLLDQSYRPEIVRTARIGVDYAGHWSRRLLRFVDVASPSAARLAGVRAGKRNPARTIHEASQARRAMGR
ncbi:MAG: DNA-3-methyladenine glycosylase [Phycisphaerae bacterium]|nr:DNA-3-methyladenine glycosylase [Phycisphaerae bacterium]MDW8262190.1 DNA-3-methyladenine glycosylase [Phycisphaerales bacterium]